MFQSDEQCVADCLDGRPDEFRGLVCRYERPIMSYLVARMGDPEAAAEAAQETFVRAFFRLHTLKKGKSFYPWLSGIAQRVMLESFRRRNRIKSLTNAPEPTASPFDDALEHDGELAAAVNRLPDMYRDVTILRYFGGLSCVEVAERLDVPLGTVTKRLSRAYALLRESLLSAAEPRIEVDR
jgi:RNA polymerase sigma-70 factor (ECF subfamily)